MTEYHVALRRIYIIAIITLCAALSFAAARGAGADARKAAVPAQPDVQIVEQPAPNQLVAPTNMPAVWECVFYESLFLHYQGRYQAVFDLIETNIRAREPGPGVHRCLAMMRRAFIDLTKTGEPVHLWSGEAQAYIARIEAKRDKDMGDAIILCVLTPREQDMDWATEPLLDEIINSNSPWRDWAYWEKARVVAMKSAPSIQQWGLARTMINGVEYTTCGAYVPWIGIRERAAVEFLRDNRETYMKQALIENIRFARAWYAERALKQLLSETDAAFYAWTAEQIKDFKATLESLHKPPENAGKVVVLERELDERLWGDFYCNNAQAFCVRYLKAVIEEKGKGTFSLETYQTVMALPDPDVEKPRKRE